MGRVKLSQLVAYEDALLIGRVSATVTNSGIVLKGEVRPSRDREFESGVALLLRQLADGVADEQISGFVAEVFDRMLAHASLGDLGHVRFLPSNGDEPTLGAHTMLTTVASRFENR
jgi:hypothetical protein